MDRVQPQSRFQQKYLELVAKRCGFNAFGLLTCQNAGLKENVLLYFL